MDLNFDSWDARQKLTYNDQFENEIEWGDEKLEQVHWKKKIKNSTYVIFHYFRSHSSRNYILLSSTISDASTSPPIIIPYFKTVEINGRNSYFYETSKGTKNSLNHPGQRRGEVDFVKTRYTF